MRIAIYDDHASFSEALGDLLSKKGHEVVKRASSMLSGAKGNVGIVLNKTRSYAPKWLLQEL